MKHQKRIVNPNQIIRLSDSIAAIRVVKRNGERINYLIDIEDIPLVGRYKWGSHMNYCTRTTGRNRWPLSWQLLGRPRKGYLYHPLNGDRRDCRKSNLRIVTWAFNNFLREGLANRSTGIRGISKYPDGSFRALIGVGCKRKSFKTLEQAIDARKQFEAAMERRMSHLKPRRVAKHPLHSQKMINRTSASKRGDKATVRE